MATPERQVVEWIDAYGNRWLQVIDSLDTGQTDAIVSALANCSNAFPFWRAKGPLLIPGGVPVASQWPSVFDRGEMNYAFTSVGGIAARVVIPAPKAALFFGDGETIDPGAGSLPALTAAVQGKLRAPNGGTVFLAVGGMRAGTAGRP